MTGFFDILKYGASQPGATGAQTPAAAPPSAPSAPIAPQLFPNQVADATQASTALGQGNVGEALGTAIRGAVAPTAIERGVAAGASAASNYVGGGISGFLRGLTGSVAPAPAAAAPAAAATPAPALTPQQLAIQRAVLASGPVPSQGALPDGANATLAGALAKEGLNLSQDSSGLMVAGEKPALTASVSTQTPGFQVVDTSQLAHSPAAATMANLVAKTPPATPEAQLTGALSGMPLNSALAVLGTLSKDQPAQAAARLSTLYDAVNAKNIAAVHANQMTERDAATSRISALRDLARLNSPIIPTQGIYGGE